MLRDTTRRSFLAGTAGVSAIAFGTGSITARQAQTFTLAMTQDGWVGRGGDIEGQSSPTLQLEADTEYAIEWTNETEERHNLVIKEGHVDGEPLVRSDFLPQGESQTVTFTAPSGPGVYLCENHNGEMGQLAVGGETVTTRAPPETTTTLEGQAGATDEPVVSYQFFGGVPGWRAQSPGLVSGQVNPTLLLVPGRIHEVVWQNVDGAPHNFLLETDDDEMLVRSDTITDSGSWQTVKFVASERMYQYYCQFHPLGMRGDVELVSEDELAQQLDGTTTTPANQTTTAPAETTPGQMTTTPANQTTMGNQTTPANQAAADVGGLARQVRTLDAGTLTALGGIGGAMSYLLSRDDEGEE